MKSDTPETKKQRTCVSCGMQASKQGLHRIVKDSEGRIAFDASGKQPGRGAYVCSGSCFEKALSTKRFERALRTKLSVEDCDRVIAEFKAIDSQA